MLDISCLGSMLLLLVCREGGREGGREGVILG